MRSENIAHVQYCKSMAYTYITSNGKPELHVLSFVKTQYTCMPIALVSNNTRTDENNNRLCVCIEDVSHVILAEAQVFCSKRRIHMCIIAKRPLKNTSI